MALPEPADMRADDDHSRASGADGVVVCSLPVVVCCWAGCEHPASHAGHDRAAKEPVALGEEPGAQARNNGHRVVIEAAQACLHDVGRAGGAAVNDAAGGGLVTQADGKPGRDRPGAQRENADPAAAGLGPQRLAERQAEGFGRTVDSLPRAGAGRRWMRRQ